MPYKNPEDRRAKARQNRIDNPEKVRRSERKAKKRWRDKDPERHLASYREWYHGQGGKDQVSEYKKSNYVPRRQHAKDLKRQYKLTIEEYESMLASQGGKCKICERTPEHNTMKRQLCVDHDHNTGKVRGLLCHQCNSGIGYLQDDVLILRSAVVYLEAHA